MAFGGVKQIFDCLLRLWRHDRTWLTSVVKFCCAVWNNKFLYQRIGNEYSSHWNHSIPQIISPKFHSKKRRVDDERYSDVLATEGSHKKSST